MGNPDWAGRDQQVQDLFVLYRSKTGLARSRTAAHPARHGSWHGWIRIPLCRPYRKSYEDMYALQAHTLSEPEEQILAVAGNITGSAAEVYGKMTNVDMRWDSIADENGERCRSPTKAGRAGACTPTAACARRISTSLFGGYKGFENTMAALTAANFKKDVFLARSRKYDNTLQSALNSVFVPEAVYITLVNTTRTHAAPFHKYEAVRKRVLGLADLPSLGLLRESVHGERSSLHVGKERGDGEEALRPLGKTYVEDITHGLDTRSGWVDVYANDNKRGGAYSSSTYGIHPYMLYNFDSEKGMTLEDVTTVAHEVGHAMHTYYSEKTQPFVNRDYAYFNAEVASTTNETIFSMKLLDDARAAYRKAKGKEKEAAKRHLIYLLDQNISSARGSFVRQTLFADWEWQAHKMAEDGQPMTAESLSKLYGDLLSEYYGAAINYGELSHREWARIPHFYRGYYVYTYATSYAAAVALAKDIRAEAAGDSKKKGATARYLNYLKSGSSKHPVELLKDAGVDMTTPAPIESCIGYIASLVDELDQLTR